MRIQLSEHFTYSKLIRFTLPSIAMMIFTSIYSVVDGFFVSNFAGKTPFAAVNLIMPFLMILSAIGFMFGAGGTALVAKTMGEGRHAKANEYFSIIVYFALGLGIVISVLGFIFMRPIAELLGAEGELIQCCVQYGRITIISMPFFILQQMFQSFFIAAEKPQLGLLVIVIAGILNMILDAVLVLTFPQELKLAAAAIATVAAEITGGTIPLIYFFRKNSSLLKLGKTSFYGRALAKSATNGMSEFATNISVSIVGVLYNTQLMKYAGETGVAAYGVMMYASLMFMAIFLGYTMGSAPIISYNYGANNKKELANLIKKGLTIISILGVCMLASAECFAGTLANIFVGYDGELFEMTLSGFRKFALGFLFMGFGIYLSGLFTALNDGITSAAISLLRTLVFECGAVMILPILLGLEGIWYAVVVAELLAMIIGLVVLARRWKKIC